MRLSVIGCGYLGTVHAAALASLGHEVIGVDTDPQRIAELTAGRAPFYEPGLQELLVSTLETGRLRFTGNIADVAAAELHFLCVGTPSSADGAKAELAYLHSALEGLLPHLSDGAVVAGKSTVPVGTAASLAASVAERGGVLVWNPEFLREGHAVADSLRPDRFVAGIDPAVRRTTAGEHALAQLRRAYAEPLAAGVPLVVTDLATAELAKGAANAFLATKVSFMNLMAEVADAAGADVSGLAEILGHDPRIGRSHLGAGLGFGGGCLPKDLRAFTARAEELGADAHVGLLREAEEINLDQRARVADRVSAALGGTVSGRRIAVLGAAFKPNSDDVRDSPALAVAQRLAAHGAEVIVTDPVALDNARRIAPELGFADHWEDALAGAEAVLLATEWDEYRRIDPAVAGTLVQSRLILDGRNCLDRDAWIAASWHYSGVGRR